MFRVGIRSIFSELIRLNMLVVSDIIIPASPKTKEFSEKLKDIDARRVLIIVDKVEVNLILASRNIPNVEVVEAANLSPVLLVGADKIIATSAAIKSLEERLA